MPLRSRKQSPTESVSPSWSSSLAEVAPWGFQLRIADERQWAMASTFAYSDTTMIQRYIDGTVWLPQFNVAPGMIEASMLRQYISAAGLSVGEVISYFSES